MRSFPRSIYKGLFVLIVVSLLFSACSMPSTSTETQQPAATPTALQQTFAPAVVETVPLAGSQIGVQEAITFYFNQPMDRVSVESAWSADPAVGGEFVWADDATLTFTPDQPLEAGASLKLNVNTSARSSNGAIFSKAAEYTYYVADALHPVQFLPTDGNVDISVDAAVAVTFDQPVVALGADPASMPAAFSIQPAAQGRGEWLNTSTYIFYPEPAFAGGETYHALLNPDLISVAGTTLARDDGTSTAWSFTTAKPRLLEIFPSTELPLPLDLDLTLTFNQPIDRASLESNFAFQSAEETLQGSFEWAEDSRSVTYTPNALLARERSYWMRLSGATQAVGGTPLGEDWDVELVSALNFSVTSTDPEQGGLANQWGDAYLHFSSNIADDIDAEDYLSISPAVENFQANAYSSTIHFSGDFDANKTYTLTVSGELYDEWGGKLGNPYELVFAQEPPDPKIYFSYTGTTLYYTAAEQPAFYVQSVNVPRADVSLGAVSLDDIFRLFGSNGYAIREAYQPASVDSWRQPLNSLDHQSETTVIPLANTDEELTPGFYFLRVWKEGDDGGKAPAFIVSSNVNLVFKFGATDALVWATDQRTGMPLVGETVSVYDEAGLLLASGQTDVNGMWRGEIPAQEDTYQNFYAMVAQPGDDLFGFSASMWGDDITPYRFGLSMDRRPPHTEVYLYTDRPIYRPGQTVYFRAVVREGYDGRYEPTTLTSLPLTISDAWGENIQSLNPTISAYGTAHGSFTLPEDAISGYYNFYNSDIEFSTSFQVAEYRKPEINLSIATGGDSLRRDDPFGAEVSAQYYFDAPAGDLPISWTLYDDSGYFRLPGYRVGDVNLGWMSGSYADYSYYGGAIASGEEKTRPDGTLSIVLSDLDLSEGIRELTLEITAQDESGQQISARESLIVHPEDFYIGVRPDLWVGREETEMGFDILTVDWKSDPSAARNLHADFKQVTWERQDPVEPYGYPIYVPTYTPVSDVDFMTGSDGAARLSFTPPTPGTYILDVSGGDASTQVLLWVTGAERAIWPRLPKNHVRLTADRDSYQPGDVAQIFIPNPLEEQTYALVTVERGTVHKSEIMAIDPGGSTYSLPLTDADAPTVFFSAVLLAGNEFRVGYAELPVDPAAQILNINLTSEPTRSEPGGEVTFGIQVTDAQGAPVQGEFSLAVIDLAALALADPNTEPIDEAFYGDARIGVRTTLSLAGDSIYGVFLDGGPGGMGGGGGGAGISVVRENFPDTAYWNAEIVTDANGQAQVSVILPDNLTTWQVDLRGLTTDTRVGSAEMQLVSTKDVLIRPVTPRFMVVGDHAQISAIVHNNTSQELSGRVTLQAIGFLLDDPNAIEQEITLPANGRVEVTWWGTAQDAEGAELLFDSQFGEYHDLTRPTWGTLPILRYTSPQSFVTAGVLESAGTKTEAISLPRSFVPSGGKLDVELSPSLAAAILDGLEAIPEPPIHASNEEILSYLLPNIEAYQALQAAGLDEPELKARLEESLNIGVNRLLARQTENYGWGWYATTASESYGGLQAAPARGGGGLPEDPYLSAYIVFGLWRANQAGVYIDETVFANAREYLHTVSLDYLSLANPMIWEKDRLAFIQFVMQMTGGADAIAVDQLDLWRDGLSPWAQALLALTLESRTPGDARAQSLLANLETSARRSASGAHWESDASAWRNPGTPTYTTATIIYALAQFDAASPLLQDAVRYLVAHRNIYGYWSSTYENAWSLLALTEVAKQGSELNASFAYSARLNGNFLADELANALTPVTATATLDGMQLSLPNALDITRGDGVGRLYYRAALLVDRAAETAPAINQGMEVTRAYYDAACEKDCLPLNGMQLTNGAKIKAQLTLTLPEDSYFVMIEDAIPAGTEILNQNLKTSEQVYDADRVELYDPDNPFSNGWAWWYFRAPQIGDEKIEWSADYLPAGTYVLSYTLIPLQAGEYRVLPAHAWQSFFPDVQGTSEGEVFVIQE
jgi:uncharacterized protein YfaS (alpha-2-macroglobulin family)